ncbi:MAG TPA: hypothetical protein PK771_06175 [Spirochaetota bacterium]|nr:hypothetical protein [Spirochaetota bacterium]
MQVAIVYIGQNKELSEYSKYFSIKLSEKNHIPTFINGILEKPRMAFFHYVVFFIESPSFFKPNYIKELSDFFKEVGRINSRYCSLFVNKTFFSNKNLLKYMQKIENEGIVLHQSDVIANLEMAKQIADDFTPIKNGE